VTLPCSPAKRATEKPLATAAFVHNRAANTATEKPRATRKPKPLASLHSERYRRAMRFGSVSCSVSLLLGALLGCADAGGRFQRFEDRAAFADAPEGSAGAAGDRGSCHPPRPGSVHGPALLALETTARPGAAILFFGQIETPELDGATAVKFVYRALDASDRRTEVGEQLVVGPYAIGPDGSFDAPNPESTLPGSANAILPGVPITSQLTLHGSICGSADFYCGSVTGSVTAPIAGPSNGQFGLALIRSIDDVPARPRFGCDEDALAPELE
jgi:hypothetical protein